MINILLPMAKKSNFFNRLEYPYPYPLIEIQGKPIIQMVTENLNTIEKEKHYIFIVNDDDCVKFHLDSVLAMIVEHNCHIIKLKKETRGAACSCLLAIEHINNEDPLLIVNSDQIIEDNLDDIFNYFIRNSADVGVICFNSIHPRWSYIRKDSDGKVIETAEKRPLSKNAIAGFYYFKHGRDFIDAAMESIKKDSHVDGKFYIAPTLNELILRNKNIIVYNIDNVKYHTFYSPQKIKDYEQRMAKV